MSPLAPSATLAREMERRLTREEIEHIAALCRIGMSSDELDGMADQLSHILDMFRILRELDTEGVPPTGHSVPLETVMRDDEPGPSLSTEDALANAPQQDGDFFKVKVVLED